MDRVLPLPLPPPLEILAAAAAIRPLGQYYGNKTRARLAIGKRSEAFLLPSFFHIRVQFNSSAETPPRKGDVGIPLVLMLPICFDTIYDARVRNLGIYEVDSVYIYTNVYIYYNFLTITNGQHKDTNG